MAGLNDYYQEKVIPLMVKEFGYSTPMAVPRLEKIVLNVGLGEALGDKGVIDKVIDYLKTITGQKGVPTLAKKSIAGFSLRAGQPIGAKVTLRGKRMYPFLERLIKVVLPRTRDFKGVDPDSLDERGNCSLGFSEQLVFPEVSYDQIDKVRGLEVTLVTSARDKKSGRRLLELLGLPFAKEEGGGDGY
jgi:large subunit ribosomal protein L5